MAVATSFPGTVTLLSKVQPRRARKSGWLVSGASPGCSGRPCGSGGCCSAFSAPSSGFILCSSCSSFRARSAVPRRLCLFCNTLPDVAVLVELADLGVVLGKFPTSP